MPKLPPNNTEDTLSAWCNTSNDIFSVKIFRKFNTQIRMMVVACVAGAWNGRERGFGEWENRGARGGRDGNFLLALRRWWRFTRNNVCDSATEIPYWWRKICPKSGQKRWLVDWVDTLHEWQTKDKRPRRLDVEPHDLRIYHINIDLRHQ